MRRAWALVAVLSLGGCMNEEVGSDGLAAAGAANKKAGPDTTITSAPSSPSASSSATFTFVSAKKHSTFECSVDGGPFVPCTSPFTLDGLADGAHTFRVRATDKHGNTDPTPAEHAWTVDTAPPETTIVSGPPEPSGPDVTFDFVSSEAGSTFECSLDGGAFVPCTSPFSLTALADGAHVFQVRAIDAAGNVDPTPATFAWTVDSSPPETTIVSGPPEPSGPNVTFDFVSSEAGSTFECSLDGAPFSPCVSPFGLIALASGAHVFQVRATDAGGNVDPTPATFAWTVL